MRPTSPRPVIPKGGPRIDIYPKDYVPGPADYNPSKAYASK